MLLLVGCSPRNGLPIGADDDDSAGASCGTGGNNWPSILPQYADYEGVGAGTGELVTNFALQDQFGDVMCLSQLLGSVLVIDASTRWCGPCNEAAAASAALWEEMKGIGPSWITTLMVQDFNAQPATLDDVTDWVDQYGIEYPVVLDDNQQTAAVWGVTSYPLFLFVAPTGLVVERREAKPSEADVLAFVDYAVQEWAADLRQPQE